MLRGAAVDTQDFAYLWPLGPRTGADLERRGLNRWCHIWAYKDAAERIEESGTVKWYNAMKGFGFIASDRGGKDIFVHASALDRAGIAGLTEGQRVAVDVIDGRKGSRGGRFTPDLKAVDCLSGRPPKRTFS